MNIEQTYRQDRLGNNYHGQLSQLYRENKTGEMQKLRREIEFLERCMIRLRMRLNRIKQDPLLRSTTSLTGITPKQLIGPEYHEYPEYDH